MSVFSCSRSRLLLMAPSETENNAYANFGVTNRKHYGTLWYFRSGQFSRMGTLPHFLSYGAPPTRTRVELRYKITNARLHKKILPSDFCRYKTSQLNDSHLHK